MILRCLLGAALVVGSIAGHAFAAGSPPADVQKLGDFPALQRLGASGPGKIGAFLKSVRRSYQTEGYPRLGAALGNAGPVISLLGQPELTPRRPTAVRARGSLRNLKKALARENEVAPSLEVGETAPNYVALARLFADRADEALANLRAGRKVGRGIAKKPATAWLTRNDDGTITGSGSAGSIIVFNFPVNATVPLTAGTDERWIAFPPGSVVPEDLVFTESFWAYSVYFDPATGAVYPANTIYRRVSVGLSVPTGAVAFPPGGITFHIVWSNPVPAELSTLNNLYYGRYAVTAGTWYLLPAGDAIPDGFESLTFVTARSINDTEYPAGTTLLRGSLAAPAGATMLPVPFLISPNQRPSGFPGNSFFPGNHLFAAPNSAE